MKKIICATLVLFFILLFFTFGCKAEGAQLPSKDVNGYYILPEATFYYNIAKESGTSFCFSPPDGYFQEPLDEEELEQLVPDGRFPCTGTASWYGTGELLFVWTKTQVDDQPITITYAVERSEPVDHPGKKITKCNGVEFVVYQYNNNEDVVSFSANGHLGDQHINISAECLRNDPEQVRAAFETAVRWMSICNAMKINASTVQYSQIPEYYELELTLSEAYDDPTFGHMLPQKLPTGLGRKSIIRRKNFATDFLSVHLGNSQNKSLHLSWQVHHFTEADADELIPSAQVSPEAVKELHVPTLRVEDLTVEVLEALIRKSDPFYVKIGSYRIMINSSGVSAEEIYGLLQQVRGSERY